MKFSLSVLLETFTFFIPDKGPSRERRFRCSLVIIGPELSKETLIICDVDRRTIDDGRRTLGDPNISLYLSLG